MITTMASIHFCYLESATKKKYFQWGRHDLTTLRFRKALRIDKGRLYMDSDRIGSNLCLWPNFFLFWAEYVEMISATAAIHFCYLEADRKKKYFFSLSFALWGHRWGRVMEYFFILVWIFMILVDLDSWGCTLHSCSACSFLYLVENKRYRRLKLKRAKKRLVTFVLGEISKKVRIFFVVFLDFVFLE